MKSPNSSISTIVFAQDPHRSASANLEAFIKHMRTVNAFGVPDWEAVRWDISGIFQRKGRAAPIRINWTDLDSLKGGIDASQRNTPLSYPFVEFAKAYLSHRHATRPASGAEGPPLMAMRVLERALQQVKKTGDISKLDANVLNVAASIARAKWAESTATQVGNKLQELAEFLTSNRLTNLTISWKSPFRRAPAQDLFRVGPEADERRKRRLPDDDIIDAVAKAFYLATEQRDVLTSSVVALLACAPDRIGEVLNLRRDALVLETLGGKPTVGIRWNPEKGGKPLVKPVPSVMQDVARKAFQQLLNVTTAGHEMATWYAKRPDTLFLPEEFSHLRDQEFLTLNEAKALLGVVLETNVRKLLGGFGALGGIDSPPPGKIRFSSFEKHVLSTLPADFPEMDRDTGLKYVDALFVVPVRFFKHGSPSRVMFARATYDHLVRQLGNSGDPQHSLFGRLGLLRLDGSALQLRTHQLRHWLNTLARKGGLSDLDIALWSGRRDVRSNAAYDNLTADDALALVKKATQSPTDELIEFVVRTPISRNEFNALKVKTGHITEFGVCVHDFAMAPCQKHRDCINCDEQICVKGNAASNDRIRSALEMTEQLHKKAIEALGDNWNGAGRWEEHHYLTLKRLRELVRILDDPTIPEGSFIKLAKGGDHSILRQALEERRQLSIEHRDAAVKAIQLFHSDPRHKPQKDQAS